MPRLPRKTLRMNYERYSKPSTPSVSPDASVPVKSEMGSLIASVRSASDALRVMDGPMANTRAALQYLSERYQQPPELIMSKWLDNKVAQLNEVTGNQNVTVSDIRNDMGKTYIKHNQLGWVEVQTPRVVASKDDTVTFTSTVTVSGS